uniref:DUF1758 domain-containing protein n=1 Tax=Loa loa TaxID=7209 RepID=A0A1I7VE31_LOALO
MSATIILNAQPAKEKLKPTFSGNPSHGEDSGVASKQQDALLAIKIYDIILENYDVTRKVLIGKFGQSHIIKKLLYNELHSIKKNDREWKVTIEAIERQHEAMGEKLEQSSIENIIENKLPTWILDRVCQQKEKREIWSIAKLGQFLAKLIQRNEVAGSQYLDIVKEPCIFCDKNRWGNECQTYPSPKQRMQRPKENNARPSCLRPGYATINCKEKKRLCFHCKGHHNTARNDRETLLFCEEVEAINLDMQEASNKVVVLFGSCAQVTCISKKLAKRLNLEDIDYEQVKFATFSNRRPQQSIAAKVRIGIKTVEADIIPTVATVGCVRNFNSIPIERRK